MLAFRRRLYPALLIAVALPSFATASPDFEKEVAPILEQTCLFCHNAHEAKGDLDLSTRAAAFGFEAGIVPGDPEASLLLEVVSGPDPDMPKKADPLSADQVQVLRDWIAAGAEWPESRALVHDLERDLDWWSLQPIAKPEATGSGDRANPVDSFVEAKLREQGLQPVPGADPATLIRRVTYDLTGLPPTPEEVDAFLAKLDWDAAVDRLLDSPAFGEKWARHWLDVARYGETHGYDKDKPRPNAWPYRDYVIRAFNDDKPYDRFVQEQVAGDALFPGEPDGVLGLGFLAAGPWDLIGHVEVGEAKLDGRIAKHLDRDEMTGAVFNVFASTTVQCAQCHHHKFDPVKADDYYRLHAVFAAVDRAERVYRGLPPEQERERNQVLARINTLRAESDKLDTGIKRAIAAKTSGIDRRIAELKKDHGAATQPQYGWHSSASKNQDTPKWVQVDLGEARAVDEVRLIPAFDTFNDIGAGFGFPLRFKVEAANDVEFKTGVRLLLDTTDADQPNPKTREVKVDVGGEPVRYLRVTATRLAQRKNDFIFALGELEAIGGEEQANLAKGAAVTSLDSIESGSRWGRAHLTDGIYHREAANPAAQAELRKLEDERAAIEAALRPPETVARLAAIQTEITGLNQQLDAIPSGELVYAAATDFPAQSRFIATAGKPRPIHLLYRGDLKSPGEVMQPGMPPLWPSTSETFDLPENATESAARAALAEALTSRDNPLLWRSIVNRLWQWTFGQPLVGTPNDFGRMGLQPTHPELLDFLAAKLRDDPQHSMKAIVRLLVTSEAYRRASTHDEANARLDANNALLWRANRRRLSAEEFRDSVLAISGVLRLDERGGPSFQDFVIEKPQHSPHYQYHLHDPEDPASHRRSIYRFIVRSQPQPLLTTLDCADPSLSVAARDESTTALQALAQWNNRLIETMSRHFAARLDAETRSPEEKVRLACQLALSREPDAAEQTALLAHLNANGSASLARVVFNLNALVYVD